MAYKFQRGRAVLSGSLLQEGAIEGTSVATTTGDVTSGNNISGSGNLLIGGTVRLDGVADAAVSVDADSFYYLDSDNLVKRDTMADYATAIAGAALAASAGVLSVGVDDSTIEVDSDALRLKDDGVTGAKLHPDVAGLGLAQDGSGNLDIQVSGALKIASDKVGITGSFAGLGLAAAGGADSIDAIDLDLNSLSSADIAAADSIVFIDADDSNAPKKDSLADLATLFAGDGLKAASSVIDIEPADFAGTGLEDDGSDNLRIAASAAGNGLSGGGGSALALDLNELVAVDVASGDFLALVDSTDNTSKKDTVDDLATLFAGAGLAAASAVLSVGVSGAVHITGDKVALTGSIAGKGLAFSGGVDSISDLSIDLSEMGAGAIADGDSFVFIDANDSNKTKQEAVADLATLFAGAGLGAASSVISVANATNGGLAINANDMQLDLNDLAAAAVDVANDSIAIIDANDSSASKKESIVDFVSGIAGAGLSAASGQLSVQGNTVSALADGGTASEGYNFFADINSAATVSLPAAPATGDVVTIKAKNFTGGGTKIIINRQGSHLIDGETSQEIESPFGAITCVYVAENDWRIV